MSKIIVSYRRSDSQAASGRIADRLIAHFGAESVFMDIDNIPFGIDFRQHIRSALSQADVLLAVIGPDWLGEGADGRSRLQEDNDPVRVEIETALNEKLRVIPVLVDGAIMPSAAALPDSLKNFSFLNAAPIDVGRDFHPHVARLIQSIDAVLAQKFRRSDGVSSAQSPVPALAARPRANTRVRIIAVAAALLLLTGAAVWRARFSFAPGAAPSPTAIATAPKQTSSDATPVSNSEPRPATTAPTISPQPAQPTAIAPIVQQNPGAIAAPEKSSALLQSQPATASGVQQADGFFTEQDLQRVKAIAARDELVVMPQFMVSRPDSSLRAGLRKFVGIWASEIGFGSGTARHAMLIITNVEAPNRATGYYLWGSPTAQEKRQFPAGADPVDGTGTGDKLTFQQDGRYSVTATLNSSGALSIAQKRPTGITGYVVLNPVWRLLQAEQAAKR
jgi:TIR domain